MQPGGTFQRQFTVIVSLCAISKRVYFCIRNKKDKWKDTKLLGVTRNSLASTTTNYERQTLYFNVVVKQVNIKDQVNHQKRDILISYRILRTDIRKNVDSFARGV